MRSSVNICIVQPTGYIHSMAFIEAARYVCALARQSGYESGVSKNRLFSGCINIVFGAHLLGDGIELPDGCIIFNTEQLSEKGGRFITERYMDRLHRHVVIDYSSVNMAHVDHANKYKVEFLNCKEIRCVGDVEKDIDVLFYGSVSDRRVDVINRINSLGVRAVLLGAVYSVERDCILARSRSVLNLHYFESQIFQQIRCFWPLINGIPVISERYRQGSAPEGYADALFLPEEGEGIADCVARLFLDGVAFDEEKNIKLANFYSLDPLPHFRRVLGDISSRKSSVTNIQVPDRVNIVWGVDYRFGYINIDISSGVGADVEVDLSTPLNFPHRADSRVFGTIWLSEGGLEEIVADNILQRVRDLGTLMTHCLMLLKVGGRMLINVPHEMSISAWKCYSHVRAFNEESWKCYTDEFWKSGWFKFKFEITDLKYNLSDFGIELNSSRVPGVDILRTPRAIESMSLCLVKCETTNEDRQSARARDPHFFLADL